MTKKANNCNKKGNIIPNDHQFDFDSGESSDGSSFCRFTSIFPGLSPAKPTKVFETYWKFAAERQAIFFER